jgi:hypothetical protein
MRNTPSFGLTIKRNGAWNAPYSPAGVQGRACVARQALPGRWLTLCRIQPLV